MKEAWIYIFKNGDEGYKIGYTTGEVDKRFKALSTGNPSLTTENIIHFENNKVAKLVENIIHNKFSDKHIKGNTSKEFFLVTLNQIENALEESISMAEELVQLDESTEEYNNLLETTGQLLTPSDEDIALYDELMTIKKELFDLDRKKDLIERKLKLRIKDSEGIENMAIWSVQTREGLDTKKFKEENPKLVEKYKKVTILRVLRIK